MKQHLVSMRAILPEIPMDACDHEHIRDTINLIGCHQVEQPFYQSPLALRIFPGFQRKESSGKVSHNP